MNKQSFFNAAQLKISTVKIDDKTIVEVQELTAKQRGILAELAQDDPTTAQAKLVIMGCQLFDDDDLDKLCNISGTILTKISDEIMRLSGLSGDEAKKN